MTKLRFALFGAGFWSRFQLSAWKELAGAECVALYNRTLSKGHEFAKEFGIENVYDNPEELLVKEKIDFIDLCTNPLTLPDFVKLAARHKIPVISQKPMAPSIAIAEELVSICKESGTPYLVHENWRWQEPIRKLKAVLDSGTIGRVFRARITMVSGYPVFINEPTLNELEKFILTDIGTHILDVARFLFGEAQSLYCLTHRIHANIKGEDVATVMMSMGEGNTTVVCELGYPEHYLEHEAFPQTFLMVEGEKGSVEIGKDYWLRITTESGTHSKRYVPECYKWIDPDYLVVHSSIVPCNEHLLKSLKGEITAETTGEDHLKTLKLTYAAYESAIYGNTIMF
jgi:predicted dehydrogenase